MTVKISMKVRTPKVPNFLQFENGSSVSIGHLSDADLKAIGEQWTKDLIDRAHEVRIAAVREGRS